MINVFLHHNPAEGAHSSTGWNQSQGSESEEGDNRTRSQEVSSSGPDPYFSYDTTLSQTAPEVDLAWLSGVL